MTRRQIASGGMGGLLSGGKDEQTPTGSAAPYVWPSDCCALSLERVCTQMY